MFCIDNYLLYHKILYVRMQFLNFIKGLIMKNINVDSFIFKFVIFGAAATMALGNVVIAPIAPDIQKSFSHVEHIDYLSRMLLTFPSITTMIFAPIMGYLMDKFGRVKLLLLGMLIWSISGSSGFYINNIYLLLFSRLILGIGTSAIIVGIPVLIGDYYFGEKKDKALGLMGFSQTAGGAVLLVISGFFGTFGWHYSFLVYLVEIFVCFIAFFVLFEPKKYEDSHNQSESRAKFDIEKFLFIYFLGFFIFLTFFIAPVQTPYLIEEVFHKNSFEKSIIVGIIIMVSGISPLFYSFLKKRLSFFRIFFLAYCLMGFGILIMGSSKILPIFIIGGMFAGAFFSISLINNISYLFSLTKTHEKGKAYGILGACISLGQLISPLVSQTFVNIFGIAEMYIIYGIVIMIFSLTFFIKKERRFV